MPEAALGFQNWEQISGRSMETATDQTEKKRPPWSSVVKIAMVKRLNTTFKQNYNKCKRKLKFECIILLAVSVTSDKLTPGNQKCPEQ